MTGQILDILRTYLPAPLFIFFLGFAGGVWIGFKFSPARYAYLTTRLTAEAAERDKRRQEQERKERNRKETAQRRLESYRERLAAQQQAEECRRYFEGIYFDLAGNPCCPACRVPLTCSGISSQSNHRFYGTCPKCQQEIKSNCDAETIFAHARQLRPF